MAARKKQEAKARVLATSVHVHEWAPVDPEKPDGAKYVARTEVFEAGQELPEWAAEQVGDHVYADESADADETADEQPEN